MNTPITYKHLAFTLAFSFLALIIYNASLKTYQHIQDSAVHEFMDGYAYLCQDDRRFGYNSKENYYFLAGGDLLTCKDGSKWARTTP